MKGTVHHAPLRQTAIALIGELGSESNAHGVARIVRSRDSRRKVLWSLVVLFGVGAAISHLSSLVHKYFQYQVVEVSEIQDGHPVEFPSVTVCNIEPISWRKLRELLNAPNDGADIMAWLEFLDTFRFGEQEAHLRSIRAFHENVGHEALYVRHGLNESLLHCSFNKQPCSTANFTTSFDGNYYSCFTFNTQPSDPASRLIVHSTGPEYGLSIVMFLDNNEPPLGSYGLYALDTNILHSAGARVMVHAPNTLPIPVDHGQDVAPGFSTSVSIKPFLHSRLPKPYGNCSDTKLRGLPRFTSTFSTCIAVCKQELIIRTCGCRSSALPEPPHALHVPYCGQVVNWRQMLRDRDSLNRSQHLPTLACEETTMERLKNDRGYETDCGCTHPCVELSYHMSTSMSYWPLELYQFDALTQLYGDDIEQSPLRRAYKLHEKNIQEGERLRKQIEAEQQRQQEKQEQEQQQQHQQRHQHNHKQGKQYNQQKKRHKHHQTHQHTQAPHHTQNQQQETHHQQRQQHQHQQEQQQRQSTSHHTQKQKTQFLHAEFHKRIQRDLSIADFRTGLPTTEKYTTLSTNEFTTEARETTTVSVQKLSDLTSKRETTKVSFQELSDLTSEARETTTVAVPELPDLTSSKNNENEKNDSFGKESSNFRWPDGRRIFEDPLLDDMDIFSNDTYGNKTFEDHSASNSSDAAFDNIQQPKPTQSSRKKKNGTKGGASGNSGPGFNEEPPFQTLEYNRQQIDRLREASTEIRQNLLRLNVYLEDLSVVKYKQMPAYGMEDLFADIGGTLGLWMGVSVLTIMELLELIFRLSHLFLKAEWKPGHIPEDDLENEVYDKRENHRRKTKRKGKHRCESVVTGQEGLNFESMRDQDRMQYESLFDQDKMKLESIRDQDRLRFQTVRDQERMRYESVRDQERMRYEPIKPHDGYSDKETPTLSGFVYSQYNGGDENHIEMNGVGPMSKKKGKRKYSGLTKVWRVKRRKPRS